MQIPHRARLGTEHNASQCHRLHQCGANVSGLPAPMPPPSLFADIFQMVREAGGIIGSPVAYVALHLGFAAHAASCSHHSKSIVPMPS